MKKILPLIVSAITLYACSSTNIVTISVENPAPVTLPVSLNTIGILNRSNASYETKKLDDADKILSMEGKNLDKEGAERCLQGLSSELKKNTRFTGVMRIKDASYTNPGLGVLPAPLPWEEVRKICLEHRVNCIYSLELYDTDSKVSYSVVPVTLHGPLGVNIPAVENIATITTQIKIGWRIYDAIHNIIMDEFLTTAHITSTGKGINPVVAIKAAIGRKEAVLNKSNHLGEQYAQQLYPYNIRVARDYYVRGTDNFKMAKRRALTGNWTGAAELWKKETTNPKRKVAGRAYYNMAIINEINGNLDSAISWSQKSYTDYKNKLALQYVNTLKYRQSQNAILKEQQHE